MQVARTSHVLFYEEDRLYQAPWPSKQRFVMDVQSYADKASRLLTDETAVPSVPRTTVPADFQLNDATDLLFADKEVDWKALRDWQGPTVLETGATGIELLPGENRGPSMPTIWTSGLGSFLRTLVERERLSYAKVEKPATVEVVLKELHGRDALQPLLDGCGKRSARYLATLVSFKTPAGTPKTGKAAYTNSDETSYGRWLQKRWFSIAPDLINLINTHLGDPLPGIGGGLVTTCHSAGMMASWRYPDGSTEHTVISITGPDKKAENIRHRILCKSVHSITGKALMSEASVSVSSSDHHLHLELSDGSRCTVRDLGVSIPYRRNTLAAGDTFRGVMSYGLWAPAFQQANMMQPANVPRVLMASAVLATLKCYAGSFVDFLKLLEDLRASDQWDQLWRGNL